MEVIYCTLEDMGGEEESSLPSPTKDEQKKKKKGKEDNSGEMRLRFKTYGLRMKGLIRQTTQSRPKNFQDYSLRVLQGF